MLKILQKLNLTQIFLKKFRALNCFIVWIYIKQLYSNLPTIQVMEVFLIRYENNLTNPFVDWRLQVICLRLTEKFQEEQNPALILPIACGLMIELVWLNFYVNLSLSHGIRKSRLRLYRLSPMFSLIFFKTNYIYFIVNFTLRLEEY